jgi:hypothetical protein
MNTSRAEGAIRSTSQTSAARTWIRGLGALLLLVAVGFEAVRHGAYAWAAIGLLAPDLALLRGGGAELVRGQLNPRAVGAYNAVHRYWGPLGLMVIALPDAMPLAVFIVGLAWAAHVAVDRALGYGLRDADGFQRER